MDASLHTTLVAARLEEALECLGDAQTLWNAKTGNRTIVSCSYYAAFYALLALLQTQGQIPKKHKGAINLFDMNYVNKGEIPSEYSKILHWLFHKRLEDDYQRVGPIPPEEAREALDKAEKFVAHLTEYLRQRKLV